MPGPEHAEVASVLLDKAGADLEAARALAPDDRQADHVVGFHAQQTVEKALKAVLAIREIEIPRTHDLAYLLTMLEDGGVTPSDEVAGCEWLTPWAGGWRYDEVPVADRPAGRARHGRGGVGVGPSRDRFGGITRAMTAKPPLAALPHCCHTPITTARLRRTG